MRIVNNIRKYLIEYNNFEINQQSLGFKSLFRGCVIKAQSNTNFNTTKYIELNEVLIKHCIKYYLESWKYRNEVLYNYNYQKRRLKSWCKEEKARGLNGEYV